jgi:hypothetical protein
MERILQDDEEAWRPYFIPEAPVGIEGENINVIISRCLRFMRELEWPREWANDFADRVRGADSYEQAVAIVRMHFILEDKEDEE